MSYNIYYVLLIKKYIKLLFCMCNCTYLYHLFFIHTCVLLKDKFKNIINITDKLNTTKVKTNINVSSFIDVQNNI